MRRGFALVATLFLVLASVCSANGSARAQLSRGRLTDGFGGPLLENCVIVVRATPFSPA
jgi:hypothetical protein